MITPDIELYQSTARVAALPPILVGRLEHLLQCCVGRAVAPWLGVLHSVQVTTPQSGQEAYSFVCKGDSPSSLHKSSNAVP
jgi:hypothetical protein